MLHINGIIQFEGFVTSLLSLSIIFSIYSWYRVYHYFISYCWQIIFYYMDIAHLFIFLSINQHLGCFHSRCFCDFWLLASCMSSEWFGVKSTGLPALGLKAPFCCWLVLSSWSSCITYGILQFLILYKWASVPDSSPLWLDVRIKWDNCWAVTHFLNR